MAKKKPKPVKKLRGGSRMKQLNKKEVKVWFHASELERIDQARKIVGISRATFIRSEMARSCMEVLKNSTNEV